MYSRHLAELEKEITGPSAAHDIAKKHMQDFPEWVKSYVSIIKKTYYLTNF